MENIVNEELKKMKDMNPPPEEKKVEVKPSPVTAPVKEKKSLSIDLPSLPLEDFEVPEAGFKSELNITNSYIGALDFGIIGSGQCGGRIVKSFYDIGYKKAIALNTSLSDLNPLDIPAEQKLKIGGEGSGKDMKKGEAATTEAAQTIFDKMKQVFGTVDKIIVTVGFGGGTGSGGLKTLIAIANKYLQFLGNASSETDVIVVAALPTTGELNSALTQENNKAIKEEMFKIANAGAVGPLLLIDNSKIEKLYRGIPPVKFWPTVNDTITGLFHMFNFLATQESDHTSFDAEDYKTLLRTSGCAVMGVTKANLGETKLSQALQDNFKKTLLSSKARYDTAQKAACIVAADNKTMNECSMDDINYGFDTIANLIGNATVYRGLYEVKSEGVRAYTFIAGMQEA